jgi:hypothetical protein
MDVISVNLQEVRMQFVRTIVRGNELADIVDIPKEFRNRNVELLILPVENKVRSPKRKRKFNPEEFEGVLHLNPDVLEKELHRMRDEWERI